ncbi:hypothetical protein CMV_020209 [Castanea mollissima]|uniref:Uncharacterized protein n=1 Tax=Castanea mollissima TaxID=60419 RepID=A0A8J4VDV6_9ROSI|nr:hypothetical protein CMV_020209 [Castanea mollissima]
MYSLYEVDVPIPLPSPPSKAVQDDRISNPKSLSPILQLKTGKYTDGMCCVQLGSILYFLGGEMNIDNPYIDEDVKKELKNVEPDVLPKVVYIFDLAIDREVKDNDDLLTSTPMNYGKASPLAFVADEKIYVIGSTIRDLEVNRIPYFEMFDPKVDKWFVLKDPPEINVNTIWVGHAVVGRKALLVGWRQKKKHLYCFDLDTSEWASISIPNYAGNFSGNTEFVGNTFYGCYYDTVAAIAPLVGEEKDELKEEEEEQEEAEEKDFQQMFKHHRLLQVSEDLGMDAIFNVPRQVQYSSSLLHLGKMYFCYVRTGMPPHPNPILANDLVIGDDKKRFISIVVFQAIGKTCDSRFLAKFLHSEHYVVDSPFPNDGFIRGCYVFGSL